MNVHRHFLLHTLQILAFSIILYLKYVNALEAEFRLGALFPIFKTEASSEPYDYDSGGHHRFAGFYTAIKEINDKADGVADGLLPNVTIKYSLFDSKRDDGKAFLAAFYAVNDAFGGLGVHALVGAASSGPTGNAALVGASVEVPQITYSATSPALADDIKYPYLLRSVVNDEYQAKAMADIVQNSFGWNNVVTISATDSYSSNGIDAFYRQAEQRNINVPLAMVYVNLEMVQSMLKEIKESAYRIIILFVAGFDAFDILTEANQLGMIGVANEGDNSFVWIMCDAIASTNLDNLMSALGDSLIGNFLLQPKEPSGEIYESFETRLRSIESKLGDCPEKNWDSALCNCSVEEDHDGKYLFIRDHDEDPDTPGRCVGIDFPNDKMNIYTPYAYDAVYVLAHAAHNLLERGGSLENGPDLLASLLNVSLTLTTGPVSFGHISGERGERQASIGYGILNWDTTGNLLEIGTWTDALGFVENSEGGGITFPTLDNERPGDTSLPTCGIGEVLPSGSLTCLRCESGTYSITPGEAACHACPSGAVCYGGSDIKALFGYWRFPNSTGVCAEEDSGCYFHECSISSACRGEVLLAEGAALLLGSNVITFKAIDPVGRSFAEYFCGTSPGEDYNQSCVIVVGGNSFLLMDSPSALSDASIKLAGAHNDVSIGDLSGVDVYLKQEEQCAAGYTGNMCAQCDASLNYGKNYSGRCYECPDSLAKTWAIALLGVLAFFVVGLAVIKMKLKKTLKMKDRLPIILKIFMSYGQMMSIFMALSFNWPAPIEGFFGVQDTVFNAGTQLISLDCVMNSFKGAGEEDATEVPKIFRQYLMWLSLPIVVVLGSCTVWRCLYFFKVYKLRKQPWDHEFYRRKGLAHVAADGLIEAHEVKSTLKGLGEDCREVSVKEIIRLANIKKNPIHVCDFQDKYIDTVNSVHHGDTILTIVILLFMLYPSIAKYVCQIFTCKELVDGRYFLQDALDTECYSPTHTTWELSLGLPGVLIYVVGIPCLGAYILYRQRSELDELHVKARYGFLYDGYKNDFFLWETWVMSRKVILIIVTVFITVYGNNTVAVTGLVVVLISSLLQFLCRPFNEKDLNALESASLSTTLFTYLCGLYFLQEDLNPNFVWALVVLIFVCNCFFVLRTLLLIREEVSILLLRLKFSILQAIATNLENIKGRISNGNLKEKQRHYKSFFLQKEAAMLEASQSESLLSAKLRYAKAERQQIQMKKELEEFERWLASEKEFARRESNICRFGDRANMLNKSKVQLFNVDQHNNSEVQSETPFIKGLDEQNASDSILQLYAMCKGIPYVPSPKPPKIQNPIKPRPDISPSPAGPVPRDAGVVVDLIKGKDLIRGRIESVRENESKDETTLGIRFSWENAGSVSDVSDTSGIEVELEEKQQDKEAGNEKGSEVDGVGQNRKVDAAALLLTGLLLGLGGLIMKALEQPTEEAARAAFLEYENQVKETLQMLAPITNDSTLDAEKFEVFWDRLQQYSAERAAAPSLDDLNWDYPGATFFSVTVMTTIGYGQFNPRTDAGKAWTIFYALISIPCFCFTLSTISRYLYQGAHLVNHLFVNRFFLEHKTTFGDSSNKKPRFFNKRTLVLIGISLFCIVNILAFASLFENIYHGWSFLDSVYFNVITLSTVGFGDFVPTLSDGASRAAFAFYILVGLSIVGSFLGFVQDWIAGATTRMVTKRK
mmetsp:Transcript_19733/g.26007  ORF Transcript_19733/g.26007 Transcript_19733/m.26007 type:complete len:1690 (+) Transcript_19733:108-5177(+)